MKRSFLFLHTFALFSAILIALPYQSRGQDVSKLFKQTKPSVVTILCYNEAEQITEQGSGFFIESGDVVTSHHVLAGASRAFCIDGSGNKLEITGIVADYPDADLVKARTPLLRTGAGLALAKTIPEEGEQIVVIGTPRGMDLTISEGIVSGIRKDLHIPHVLQITAPVSEGSSGSPVLNMEGEVVGVVESMFLNAENVGFATPSEFLATMQDQQPTPLRVWSAGLEQATGGSEDSVAVLDPERAKFISNYEAGRGKDYFEQKDYKSAIAMFERAIFSDASNGTAWFGAGQCFEIARDFDHAAEAFQNASELMPGEIAPQYHLSKSLFFLGKYEDAIVACKSILTRTPQDGYTWNGLGRCYLALDSNSRAIDAFQQAIRYAPDLAQPHAELGMIFFEENRFTDAEQEFDAAIAKERSAEYLIGLGALYLSTDRADRARPLLMESLRDLDRAGPEQADPKLLSTLGGLLFRLGMYGNAVEALQLGLAIDPRSAVMHHDLGSCYMLLKEPEVAIGEFKEAVRYGPSVAQMHYDLGLAEFQVHHDTAAALVEYNILQKLDANAADQLLQHIKK